MSTCDRLEIDTPPHDRQTDALRLVFQNLGDEVLEDLVGKLLPDTPDAPLPLSGLLEARRGERIVGAVFAQMQPGATAVVWPPELVDGEEGQTAAALMDATVDFLQAQPITMAQALVEADSRVAAVRLETAGFKHATDLLYMVSTEASFPTTTPKSSLEFEPTNELNRSQLAHVVEQTYEQTRDCPSLGGVRNIEDVLAGYQATGVFDQARWLIVRSEARDVGCLLLADHPETEHMELVYMGIVPEARGNGWGVLVTRWAQWITRTAGRERLVLAVDAANSPALDMYTHCGFISWEQRSVFLRFFEDGQDQP